MRITYLHQYFMTPDQSGGTRSYVFAKHLADAGHEVTIVSGYLAEGQLGSEELHPGLTVRRVGPSYDHDSSFLARRVAFLRFAAAASWLTARTPADVVYATSTPLTIAIPAIIGSRLRSIPYVLEVRDQWPAVPIALGVLNTRLERGLARALERLAYARAKAVVALSPDMASGINEVTGRDEAVVLPNGADMEPFDVPVEYGARWRDQHGIADSSCVLLYPGTLGIVNDVHWLADFAVAAIAEFDHFVFVSIGGGREKDVMLDALAAAGVPEGRAHVLPPVPKAEMPTVFSAADIVISTVKPIPELEANSANKFFDALASGTPMVINHGGWQQRALEDAEAGRRLPRPMADALDALKPLVCDAELRCDTGRRARALAASDFDRQKLAAELEVLLRKVNAE